MNISRYFCFSVLQEQGVEAALVHTATRWTTQTSTSYHKASWLADSVDLYFQLKFEWSELSKYQQSLCRLICSQFNMLSWQQSHWKRYLSVCTEGSSLPGEHALNYSIQCTFWGQVYSRWLLLVVPTILFCVWIQKQTGKKKKKIQTIQNQALDIGLLSMPSYVRQAAWFDLLKSELIYHWIIISVTETTFILFSKTPQHNLTYTTSHNFMHNMHNIKQNKHTSCSTPSN